MKFLLSLSLWLYVSGGANLPTTVEQVDDPGMTESVIKTPWL